MRTKNAAPTAEQKRWREWLVERGCFITGDIPQLHHFIGAAKKAKINGMSQKVGEWAIIPLCYWWHMCPENPDNVDWFKKRFEARTGYTEKEIFKALADEYGLIPEEVVEALMRY